MGAGLWGRSDHSFIEIEYNDDLYEVWRAIMYRHAPFVR